MGTSVGNPGSGAGRIPTFALLIVRLDGWYQGRIWHGAMTAARLLGIRLLSLIGTSYGDPLQRGGPAGIYRLANSGGIDGYLPLVGALGNYQGIEVVRDLMDSLPPRPTVCVGAELPGFAGVLPRAGGIDLVVKHLAQKHGRKDIAFLGGNPLNPDAIHRRSDFHRAMREMGLDPDPVRVASSNFTPEGAYEVFRGMLDSHGLPEAIVCANDAMALGVHRLCRERGIRIPEDLLLTGFDDIEEAGTLRPSLTTIDAMTYQVAFRSVELLHEILGGGKPRVEQVNTCLLVRRSCGCRQGETDLHLPSILTETAQIPTAQALADILSTPEGAGLFLERLEKAMDKAEHAELNLWEECLFKVSRGGWVACDPAILLEAQAVISQARHGLDQNRRLAVQLLLRDWTEAIQKLTLGMDSDDIGAHYIANLQSMAPYHMRILLFRPDGSPLDTPPYGIAPFQLEIDIAARWSGPPKPDPLLDPADLSMGSWVTLPLAMHEEHYGIVQLRDWVSNELFLDSMRHTLSMSLSLFQRSRVERDLRKGLERLSQRDELTGTLNRRGLVAQGTAALSDASRSGAGMVVFLFDMDGLKSVNDIHGHADGDLAIRCLAQALVEGFGAGQPVGRLGGDEFAVVARLESEAEARSAIERVRGALSGRVDREGRSWRIGTSAGYHRWDPLEGGDLESALSKADAMLYQDKIRRRGGRA